MTTTERITYKTQSPKPEKTDSEYDAQAMQWLEETDSRLEIAFDHTGPYFDDDKEQRDIYKVTLLRAHASYTFTFGQSIFKSNKYVYQPNGGAKKTTNDKDVALNYGERILPHLNRERAQPSAYSILAGLEHYNPGTFEDWCAEMGCDTDSRTAEKTWRAVVEQWLSLSRMYTQDQLDKLAEIV